jgi:hypothetical protein
VAVDSLSVGRSKHSIAAAFPIVPEIDFSAIERFFPLKSKGKVFAGLAFGKGEQ